MPGPRRVICATSPVDAARLAPLRLLLSRAAEIGCAVELFVNGKLVVAAYGGWPQVARGAEHASSLLGRMREELAPRGGTASSHTALRCRGVFLSDAWPTLVVDVEQCSVRVASTKAAKHCAMASSTEQPHAVHPPAASL
eukprot:7236780-Prymnesium_polylepis.2